MLHAQVSRALEDPQRVSTAGDTAGGRQPRGEEAPGPSLRREQTHRATTAGRTAAGRTAQAKTQSAFLGFGRERERP